MECPENDGAQVCSVLVGRMMMERRSATEVQNWTEDEIGIYVVSVSQTLGLDAAAATIPKQYTFVVIYAGGMSRGAAYAGGHSKHPNSVTRETNTKNAMAIHVSGRNAMQGLSRAILP